MLLFCDKQTYNVRLTDFIQAKINILLEMGVIDILDKYNGPKSTYHVCKTNFLLVLVV